MHDRPTAVELLDDIADLLTDGVLPALAGGVQHHVRVAANLCRILERELRLGPALAAAEERLLRELLPGVPSTHDIAGLHEVLAEKIRVGDPIDHRATRAALLAITRGKLAIVKPGYDDFDFADEVAG